MMAATPAVPERNSRVGRIQPRSTHAWKQRLTASPNSIGGSNTSANSSCGPWIFPTAVSPITVSTPVSAKKAPRVERTTGPS